ncbi:MAG: transposase [Deltaproteobacteria bacterium]|nr:transposase [Deltaproteobacteria bacterium]
MARPLRITFPGACYHVTARGNERKPIFRDDRDRARFLEILADSIRRFGLVLHAYVLMRNHYHLLLETPEANLARAMRQLNGVYTQDFNRRHRRVGHVLQGRYKAIVIEKDSYLLELSRYIHLNPVRVGEVAAAARFAWSSTAAYVGRRRAPQWLRIDEVLSHFGRRRRTAQRAYARFVAEGVGAQEPRPWEEVVGQTLLGAERWMERMRRRVEAGENDLEVPARRQLRRRPPLSVVFTQVSRRAGVRRENLERPTPGRVNLARLAAVQVAWELCGATQGEIGAACGVTPFAVSKMLRRAGALKATDRKFRKLIDSTSIALQT